MLYFLFWLYWVCCCHLRIVNDWYYVCLNISEWWMKEVSKYYLEFPRYFLGSFSLFSNTRHPSPINWSDLHRTTLTKSASSSIATDPRRGHPPPDTEPTHPHLHPENRFHPRSPSLPWQQHPTTTTPPHKAHPKLETPHFDGQNAMGWIFKIS